MKRFEIKYYVEEYGVSMLIIANNVTQITSDTIEADGVKIVIETSFIDSINVL